MLHTIVILESSEREERALEAALRAVSPRERQIRRVRDITDVCECAHDEPTPPLVLVHGDAEDRGRRGIRLVAALRLELPDLPIVYVATQADPSLARRVVEAGALDLLVLAEPLEDRVRTLLGKLGVLFSALERAHRLDEQNTRLHERVESRFRLLGSSPQMRRLEEQIERVARIPRPILIQGERGTGKELVARAIHRAQTTHRTDMVTVNCAAFNESLLESELFGHEKGAFTGAERARPGRFEQADGATLFLDEIGNMPLGFQQKILRVVEYGTFTRVGGTRERKTSARIIAATNADLLAKIERGEFLSDLYDRLAFEVIQVPPLRERPSDIEALAQVFLEQFAREIPAFRGKHLSASAIALLADYDFPGNVRELKNIIERAAYRDTTNEITPEDIGLLSSRALPAGAGGGFKAQVRRLERQLLEDALARAGGNRAEAARQLELSYDQFRHYARRLLD